MLRFLTWLAAAAALHGADLRGRVVRNDTGEPVPFAEVRVYRAGVAGLYADLEADGDGKFEALQIAGGEYRIEVSKSNYSAVSLQVTAGEPVLVKLVRHGVIAGRVTNASGQGVPGAAVVILKGPAERQARVPVDVQGRYRLYGLPPGEYVVAASYGASTAAVGAIGQLPPASGVGSGFQVHPRTWKVSGGEEYSNVDFVVAPGVLASVSGRIEGEGKFWAALAAVDQPAMAVAVAPAADNGTFRLEGIAPGSYHLFAAGPVRGYGMAGASLGDEPLFARTRVSVAGPVEGVVLSPRKGVSGVVRIKASPGCSVRDVRLQPLEDWGASLERTVKEGTISGLAPGRYAVSASAGECNGEGVLDLTGGSGEVQLVVEKR